jgi:hypothetical protein
VKYGEMIFEKYVYFTILLEVSSKLTDLCCCVKHLPHLDILHTVEYEEFDVVCIFLMAAPLLGVKDKRKAIILFWMTCDVGSAPELDNN